MPRVVVSPLHLGLTVLSFGPAAPGIYKELLRNVVLGTDLRAPLKLEIGNPRSSLVCNDLRELQFTILANHLVHQLRLTQSAADEVRTLLATYRSIWAGLSAEYSNDEIRQSVGAVPGLKDILLHCLIRRFKPNLVLETGVAQGISSVFILEALAQNGFGRLISIDFPNYDPSGYTYPGSRERKDPVYVRRELGSGWIVPDRLRSQWTLLIGKSRDLLPKITEPIGLFFHDSEHSYENMILELNWAFERVTEGGIIVCDDIDWNTAFKDFFAAHRSELHLIMSRRKGACMKI